ncbi:PDR/VanB family oxidoreductase [Pseudolysinimonas sp.]|uniref:PDR/VanB family oxidoreductase n=1 Tax=Pseudolysinimonas sp. TaxID=2680009 RepID=UPI003F811F6C
MNRPRSSDVDPVVLARTDVADGLAVLELGLPDGAPMPSWEPGAHVDVLLPSGLVRQYSLCGDPDAPTWRLGVLREAGGRGGSAEVLRIATEGRVLRLAGPRTHFSFDARSSAPALLIAGGIGITPIAPMAALAAEAGADYVLHYAGHDGRMALVDALRARHGDRLVLHVDARPDVGALIAGSAPDAIVYCCGPASLIDAVEAACLARGREFRTERFEAETLTPPVWDGPFEVELEASGLTLEVPPERSVLEVVEEAGVLVLSSCTEGTCGTCETPVLEGEVDHRDSILTPAERARNDVMFVCVSRAACPRLVLDL